MPSERRREHVGAIGRVAAIGRDEERMERGPARSQSLVIADEEATSAGCCQHIERARDVYLVSESSAVISRAYEPVVGWQRGGLRCETAEVVESDTNLTDRVDADARRKSWSIVWCVRIDPFWSAPMRSTSGRGGDGDLVGGSAGESSVFPDDVQLSGGRVDCYLR